MEIPLTTVMNMLVSQKAIVSLLSPILSKHKEERQKHRKIWIDPRLSMKHWVPKSKFSMGV
jgi:hypothetical protein